MKINKKVVIVILFLLITLTGALLLPKVLNKQNKEIAYSGKKDVISSEVVQDEKDNQEETLKIPNSNDYEEFALPMEEKYPVSSIAPTDGNNLAVKESSIPEPTPQEEPTKQEPVKQEPVKPAPTETAPTTPVVKEPWVQEKIDENIEDIDEVDLATGLAIYSKVDSGYLSSLSEGGMTDAEKIEAQNYLHSVLTDAEYAVAIVLFTKNSGLVN